MDKQVTAKCPKCGFWTLISAGVQDATVASTSMYSDRAGLESLPDPETGSERLRVGMEGIGGSVPLPPWERLGFGTDFIE